MKIILLTSSLSLGGTERVVADLCNTWGERGDEVTLILTYSGGAKQFYSLSEKVEAINLADVVGIKRFGVLSYAERLLALRRLIVARSPDVIVSFLPNVNVAAILSSAFLRTPLIICERSDPIGYSRLHILEVLRKRTYRYADVLAVQTQSIADRFKSLYPGLKGVCAIPNALPAEILSYHRNAGRPRKVLLSLGRLAPEKQLDRLLDAFAKVAWRFDDWDLHIYGDGPSRAALEEKIRSEGMQGRAFLKGATQSPWKVMADADAFVMVSQYEGFPNALLEAMGIGLPCIAFDCPSGPRELSRDGQDALLVPLNDDQALIAALVTLMSSATFRIDLGRHARESVFSRFSHVHVMKSWDQLFQQVGAMR